MNSKERCLQALIVEFCRFYEISEEYVQEIFEESRDLGAYILARARLKAKCRRKSRR
nr:MAG: hypothetical protein [Bacteriophage sp.]